MKRVLAIVALTGTAWALSAGPAAANEPFDLQQACAPFDSALAIAGMGPICGADDTASNGAE
ncbi:MULTISPECIES: hypothetical protein [Nocardiopsis]|uniref:hypothetical protein n=1 Tax=Nocardiopsis TaxID=2013 RepID=UPI00034792DD|nr:MULTISPECIES: hypothetical protein [Nocardiopsis]PWV46819.1 hypothetical protein BDW27_113128 [Nocardiopsis sp. L17-MgMaSL7]